MENYAELNRIVTVQECDATMLNRITNAGYKKNKNKYYREFIILNLFLLHLKFV